MDLPDESEGIELDVAPEDEIDLGAFTLALAAERVGTHRPPNLREGTDQRCSNCVYFDPFTCTRYAYPVHADQYCDDYTPIDSPDAIDYTSDGNPSGGE